MSTTGWSDYFRGGYVKTIEFKCKSRIPMIRLCPEGSIHKELLNSVTETSIHTRAIRPISNLPCLPVTRTREDDAVQTRMAQPLYHSGNLWPPLSRFARRRLDLSRLSSSSPLPVTSVPRSSLFFRKVWPLSHLRLLTE